MDRYFQHFFVFRSAAFLGGMLLLACFAAYWLLWMMIAGEPGGVEKPLFERVRLMVWFAVSLYGIIAANLIILVGLYSSHKVAGPLYRLERMTTDALGGNLPGEIHFREGDQMQPLARAQSAMFTYLSGREREMAEAGTRVERACGALAEGAVTASPEEWSGKVDALRRELAAVASSARPRGR